MRVPGSAFEPRSRVVRTETANGPIVLASMRGEISPVEFYETFTAKLGIGLTYDEFTEIWNGLLTPNLAIDPLLDELGSEGYPLALASNTDQIHFRRALEISNAVHLFERYYLSCEMGLSKPDPRFFLRMLKDLGVPAEDCVFIDDFQPNVEAAGKLGITVLQFQDVAALRRDLVKVL